MSSVLRPSSSIVFRLSSHHWSLTTNNEGNHGTTSILERHFEEALAGAGDHRAGGAIQRILLPDRSQAIPGRGGLHGQTAERACRSDEDIHLQRLLQLDR